MIAYNRLLANVLSDKKLTLVYSILLVFKGAITPLKADERPEFSLVDF